MSIPYPTRAIAWSPGSLTKVQTVFVRPLPHGLQSTRIQTLTRKVVEKASKLLLSTEKGQPTSRQVGSESV
jgi:hypothetical protein